jgi:hypothetical protein
LFIPAMFLLPPCCLLLETVTSTDFIKTATVNRLSEKTSRDPLCVLGRDGDVTMKHTE